MRFVALLVFSLHILAEAGFGLRGFLSGTFSWQAVVDVGALEAQVSSSARFLTSGLLALAALGAWALFVAGVGSVAGRAVAGVLALFHLLGVLGIVLTALEHPEIMGITNTQGAFLIHAVLGLGFLGVVLGHSSIARKAE